METLTAIDKRHSYRGLYKNIPVPREDLRKILDAGLAAPSGGNRQTTSLIALDDPELVNTVTNITKQNGFSGGNAPAGIIVLTQQIPGYANKFFNIQDYSAVIENILIAVTSLGYASCWIEGQVTAKEETQQEIAKLLNIPADYVVVCYLPVGVAETEGRRPGNKPFEERAWFNGYRKS